MAKSTIHYYDCSAKQKPSKTVGNTNADAK